jgi:phospholipase/carboxylesterase
MVSNMSEENLKSELSGRESEVIAGRFGEAVQVQHALFSKDQAQANTRLPMFLLLHGWGSNEQDLADLMRYVAPYNDYVALRAPLDMPQELMGIGPAGYTWFHDCVPTGDDLDRDAYAASVAIDRWVREHIPADRDIVLLGFSQGGVLAVHLLRINPERYRASVCLSGFLAPGNVEGSAPADEQLAQMDLPVFYGYGSSDNVIPRYELFAMDAWLEEHTWLTSHEYRGLDHAVSLEEFSDIRQWLIQNNISSGMM